MPSILFYGDPHGRWQPLFDAVSAEIPDGVVIVGDLGLEAPFTEVLAPLISRYIPVRWIPGNHDCHTPEAYNWLWNEGQEYGPLDRPWMLGDVRIAGLGGVFKGRIWYPRIGTEDATCSSPREWIRRHRHSCPLYKNGLPLHLRDAIWPSQVQDLLKHEFDIMVTHEAPAGSDPERGFGALDNLAAAVGVRMVVHGHHHRSADGHTRHGIPVRSLGIAEPWMWHG